MSNLNLTMRHELAFQDSNALMVFSTALKLHGIVFEIPKIEVMGEYTIYADILTDDSEFTQGVIKKLSGGVA